MSYSCSDFTDDVLNALGAMGAIEGVPQDDPSGQAELALPAIYALHRKAELAQRELDALVGMPESERECVEAAMLLLRKARALLKAANAPKATQRVRGALKSADGARRNARCRLSRQPVDASLD